MIVSVEKKNVGIQPSGIYMSPERALTGLTWEVQEKCRPKGHFLWNALRYMTAMPLDFSLASPLGFSSVQLFDILHLQAGIEGLQAIKPRLRDQHAVKGTSNNHQMCTGFNNTSSVGDHGVDVEATMVIGEDEIDGAKWTMDNVKFSVKEPV
jgi:hypothetical protein